MLRTEQGQKQTDKRSFSCTRFSQNSRTAARTEIKTQMIDDIRLVQWLVLIQDFSSGEASANL